MLNDFHHFHFKLDLILFLLNDVPLSRVFTVTNSSQSFLTLRHVRKRTVMSFVGEVLLLLEKKLATGERQKKRRGRSDLSRPTFCVIQRHSFSSFPFPSTSASDTATKIQSRIDRPDLEHESELFPSFQVILIFLLRLLLHFFSYSLLSSTSITTGSKLLDHLSR